MELSTITIVIIFVNFYSNPSFIENRDVLNPYLMESTGFFEHYVETRYGLDTTLHWYHLYGFNITTYEDLQKFDKTNSISAYYAANHPNTIEVYVTYDEDMFQNKPIAGYCNCIGREWNLSQGDMLWVSMNRYHTDLPLDIPIYNYYSEYGRTGTHELDHMVGRNLGEPGWLSGVHEAVKFPHERWEFGDGWFTSQKDFRFLEQ